VFLRVYLQIWYSIFHVLSGGQHHLKKGTVTTLFVDKGARHSTTNQIINRYRSSDPLIIELAARARIIHCPYV